MLLAGEGERTVLLKGGGRGTAPRRRWEEPQFTCQEGALRGKSFALSLSFSHDFPFQPHLSSVLALSVSYMLGNAALHSVYSSPWNNSFQHTNKDKATLLRHVMPHREKTFVSQLGSEDPVWVCFIRVEVSSEITEYKMIGDLFFTQELSPRPGMIKRCLLTLRMQDVFTRREEIAQWSVQPASEDVSPKGTHCLV